jgi:hypothetical protein
MRSAAHRYDPRLRPVSHRTPRSGWPPFVGAAAMILLGLTAVVLTLAASRGPSVGPVHTVLPPVAGVPLVPQHVASDPPVGQGDDGQGQQRGDDPASRSSPRPVPTSTGIADPPLAPAAGNPPEATPAPLLLPVPTSPPPMAVPSPSLTPGPGCGRKPPHPTKSPKAQVAVPSDDASYGMLHATVRL